MGRTLANLRVASVLEQAQRVWKSKRAAHEFLYRPHQLLGGRKPINLALESESGAEQVRQLLGRLEVGSAP